MLKKILLTSVISMSLLTVYAAPSAEISASAAEEPVEHLAAGQEMMTTDAVNSTEVNTVEVSATAQRMTQAEKAHNAAVNDPFGGAITIVAMCIVVSALVVLSILFLGFGKISLMLQSKRKREAHGVSKETAEAHHEEADSGEVIAAIALALAEHLDARHDMEDTILTIKKLRRAYSPWNSKIYNMRHDLNPQRNVLPICK